MLFGLTLTNPAAAKTVPVKVDAHSELMGAYPWGDPKLTPNASGNVPDQGRFDGRALAFTDGGTVGGGAPVHHYSAVVASNRTPAGGVAAASGGAYRGPQTGTVCAASDSSSLPRARDDGPFGRGTGGELRYGVTVPAHGSQTVWVAVAGSDQGLGRAQNELARALRDPGGELRAKIAARRALSALTRLSLPGDRLLQNAIDGGKQNLADLTQSASNLQIRWTNQGTQFPAPIGTLAHARWFGAGYPDYPWIFATDAEYTALAAVGLGQFSTIEDDLRALRDISDILNHRSGSVVHETVSDGSVYFGHDSQTAGTNDFNTDETVKFRSAVALVWRRTGERPGMGPEKLDNGVYYMRGLLDLADMARSKGDAATAAWASRLAARLRRQFERTWWDRAAGQYADSLIDPGNAQSFQKHWIGQVPMEAELAGGTTVTPGVASRSHRVAALRARESACFSGVRPGNLGLFHTGCGGGADGKGDFEIFSLTTSIQAVGEGNYGRFGPGQQRRYTDANAETTFFEPATGGTPDEQPGAMPEIFPSTPQGNVSAGIPPNIDRCWTCRSMVMQAWGNYGTAWPVVHQQLGVRPFLG